MITLEQLFEKMRLVNITISTNNKWNRRISVKFEDDGSGCFYYGNVKISQTKFKSLEEAYTNLRVYYFELTGN